MAHQKVLAEAAAKAKEAAQAALVTKNKEAAKVHLLAMQCLLARMSTK
jgi:hypothetical protein